MRLPSPRQTLDARYQLAVGLGLAALLIATRGHHFAAFKALPSASWAVFFLAGVYVRPLLALPALLVLTWFVDFAAFTWGDASGFCLTSAYGFLLPAYGTLWFAGRWYAGRHRFAWRSLWPLAIAVVAGAAVCKLISGGSFYFLSGRFAEPTLAEFAARLAENLPAALLALTFYIALAALIHITLVLTRRRPGQQGATAG